MPCTLEQVYERKPEWIQREISRSEAILMSHFIRESGATVGAEVGVASGFSSAVLLAAMGGNTRTPALHSFDVSTSCYFDRSRMTGDAVNEIHGSTEGFHLTTGVTSADVTDLPPLDFIFVDGSHATPWPALDVLSLGRFLKPGGWIALDDVDLLFSKRWRIGGKNGPRDLLRAWRGPKVRYAGATSIAFLQNVSAEVIARSVANSLMVDWDVALSAEHQARFLQIAEHYGEKEAERIARLFKGQRKSHKAWQPASPPEGLLPSPEAG